jgi:hypothetical protein
LIKLNLELLKLRDNKRQLRMLPQQQRKVPPHGKRGHKMPKRMLPKKWPKTRQKLRREKLN